MRPAATIGGRVQSRDFSLPYSSAAAAIARRLADEELGPLLTPERAIDLRLLVTELVTNAVRHSWPLPDGTIGLHLALDDDRIRVAVTDGGSHLEPDRLSFDTATDRHFGMYLVDTRADGWGFSLDGVKGVWFELER
jgi:anti-sigma regulatory factor (Ser/Thr protein kinase)